MTTLNLTADEAAAKLAECELTIEGHDTKTVRGATVLVAWDGEHEYYIGQNTVGRGDVIAAMMREPVSIVSTF